MIASSSLFSLDARSLGLSRILIGITLIFDLLSRWRNAEIFFSNDGLYPNHYALFAPFDRSISFLLPFRTTFEISILFFMSGVVYLLFTLGRGGFAVKLLTLCSAVSINTRNEYLENGGHIVLNLLLTFNLFLPTESVFRWPAITTFFRWNRCKRWLSEAIHKTQGVQSTAAFGIWVSILCIYFFNAITKTGETWQSGSALYYSLLIGGRVTSFGLLVREYIPSEFLLMLGKTIRPIELLIPLLLLSPLFNRYCRAASVLLQIILHGGIGSCLVLGPFSPAMVALALMLAPPGIWDLLSRESDLPTATDKACRGNGRPITEVTSLLTIPAVLRLLLPLLVTYAVVVHSIYTYLDWSQPSSLSTHAVQTSWSSAIVDYLHIPQNWRMGAPDMPVSSSIISWVGTTEDGRKIDIDRKLVFNKDQYSALFDANSLGYQRVEWDTRFQYMGGEFFRFATQYITRTFSGKYQSVDIVIVERKSPSPDNSDEPQYGEPQTLLSVELHAQ